MISPKTPKNVAASVRQRLLNRARADKRPFNELLQYYAMERVLYRLSLSEHAQRFILKGALMLSAWGSPGIRPTVDIDMLGRTENEVPGIVAQIQDVLAVEVEPDGLIFDANSIKAQRITEDADYEGIRIRFRGELDAARITIQIDIGFGDVLYPGPEVSELPTILDSPAPKLLCYSRESTIAEKFEAMVKLGSLNSRMKDFFDIWMLSRQFDFDGADLAEAVRLTFERRGTALTDDIEAFKESFIDEKQVQWAAFRKRLEQDYVPTSFRDIVVSVEKFLAPICSAVTAKSTSSAKWVAPGLWI